MKITLTNLPINLSPLTKSRIQMSTTLHPEKGEEWEKILLQLSVKDIVSFELSNLSRNPFTGITRLEARVSKIHKHISYIVTGMSRLHLISVELKFISVELNIRNSTIIDELKKDGWHIT